MNDDEPLQLTFTGEALRSARKIKARCYMANHVPTDGELFAFMGAYLGLSTQGLAEWLWGEDDGEADA